MVRLSSPRPHYEVQRKLAVESARPEHILVECRVGRDALSPPRDLCADCAPHGQPSKALAWAQMTMSSTCAILPESEDGGLPFEIATGPFGLGEVVMKSETRSWPVGRRGFREADFRSRVSTARVLDIATHRSRSVRDTQAQLLA